MTLLKINSLNHFKVFKTTGMKDLFHDFFLIEIKVKFFGVKYKNDKPNNQRIKIKMRKMRKKKTIVIA